MAEQSNTIFRQTAIDHMQSPEDLNDYIRVTTPSSLLIIAAIAVVLAGIFVWGFFGSVEVVGLDGIARQVRPIEWVLGNRI